jgi:NADPH:quinone reductase-like Zn-dependent oxidoreductase/3-oxoacyl-(acyl-carrier-protein) synthase/acyl carrier protein/SAM-dependent methyltransferase
LWVAENKLSAETDDWYCRATWTNADWYHCTVSADFEIYRNNRLFCKVSNFVAKKICLAHTPLIVCNSLELKQPTRYFTLPDESDLFGDIDSFLSNTFELDLSSRFITFRNVDYSNTLKYGSVTIDDTYQMLIGDYAASYIQNTFTTIPDTLHYRQEHKLAKNLRWDVYYGDSGSITIDEAKEKIHTYIKEKNIASPEVEIIDFIGPKLHDILCNRVNMVEELFNSHISSAIDSIYTETAQSQWSNVTIAKQIQQIQQNNPGKVLRILEIGAGTGGTTKHIIEHVDMTQVFYNWTDIGTSFVRKAIQTFFDVPNMVFHTFDVSKCPYNQNFVGEYDIVIAANVLHATKNLNDTFENIEKLFSPSGGTILMYELSTGNAFIDMTFGMTTGWWDFYGNDSVRSDYPLLEPNDWKLFLCNNRRWTDFQYAEQYSGHVVYSVGFHKNKVNDISQHHNKKLSCQNVMRLDHLESIDDVYDAIPTIKEFTSKHTIAIFVLKHAVEYNSMKLDPIQAFCWGMLLSVQNEFSTKTVHLVDSKDSQNLSQLLDHLQHQQQSSRIVYLDSCIYHVNVDHTYVPKVKNAWSTLSSPISKKHIDLYNSSFVVTGGNTGLGLATVVLLVEQGVKNILILSKSGKRYDYPVENEMWSFLDSSSSSIIIRQCNIENRKELFKILEDFEGLYGKVSGVIHSAGVVRDKTFMSMDATDYSYTFQPKCRGLNNLSEYFSRKMDVFIAYSSVAGLIGNSGQANHSASNNYMMALINNRHIDGLDGSYISWGAWGEIGYIPKNNLKLTHVKEIPTEIGRIVILEAIHNQKSCCFCPGINKRDEHEIYIFKSPNSNILKIKLQQYYPYMVKSEHELNQPQRWVFAERGSLSNLRYLPIARRTTIDPNMVEVEIEATSVNFRDVLNVIGSQIDRTVSADDFIGHNPGPIGGDIAGRVVRVGSDVSEFQPGDRVWGFGTNSFGNFTTTHRSLLSKVCSDSKITQSEYAAMPVVMMTTEYCVVDLGKVKLGDWVLVHAATGGVGQCVIQYCNKIGATVVATCGSEEKRQLLRQQGVKYIFNSRDAELFASEYDEALPDTEVDVVINSLSDKYIDYSVSRLKPNGVFIEIGKRATWSYLEMKRYRSDISYYIARLDEMIKTKPQSAGDLLRRVNCRLNDATDPLRPLAITEYPMSDLVDAFRVLQRGENVGKIVLTNPAITNKISQGTVLIVGGTGALGCHLARWLSTKGYDDIHLLSRSGKFPDELSDLKLKVKSFAVDCTNELAVRRHIDKFDRIIGVVCCAGVLRDQHLPRTDAEIERYLSDYQMVWDTKVRSAETMDRVSGNFNLDFFVTYSSVAATFGNTGQTNYSAANAALDSLIERRNKSGLPGLSIQWGPWSLGSEHSGMATEQIRKQLEQQGIVAIDEMMGYAALDRWFYTQGIVAIMPRKSVVSDSTPKSLSDWRTIYASNVNTSMPKQERTDMLTRLVSTTLQTILSLPSIESDATFGELGIDSLTGIEFVQTLSRETGLKLSSTTIYEYSTIRTLGEHLFERIESELLATNASNASNVSNTTNTPNKTISPLVATSNNQPAESTVESTVESSIGVLAYDIICPGASNKTEFWDNLTTGKTSIVHRFPKRVIGADVDNNQSFERYGGGFIDETTMDQSILKQYPTIDPQQQLGIQMTQRLLESLSRETRKRSRIGVLVGCSSNAHSQTTTNPQSSALSCIGGRIGQHFDLNGPVMTIDTACSSSLVALDSAMMILQAKKADYVVVLGINWIHDCSVYRSFAEHHLLSSDGAVHTYGAGGTGFVRAESVAGVLLCRSDITRSDPESLHTILATATNHNGRATSMGVPRGKQLRALFEECLSTARLTGSDVDAIETHTVGTELGDAIELNAMNEVYSDSVVLTSCKPNIGHPEPAAGLTQLVKVLLMADHLTVPPTIIRGECDKSVQRSDDTSERPNGSVEPWKPYERIWESTDTMTASVPLRSRPILATTSIGFSGTNAHVIVRGKM